MHLTSWRFNAHVCPHPSPGSKPKTNQFQWRETLLETQDLEISLVVKFVLVILRCAVTDTIGS